jgi:hypothetical protein
VHGGAWRSGEAKDYAFPAELFANAAINFVVLDFVSAGAAQGDIGVMAQQVRMPSHGHTKTPPLSTATAADFMSGDTLPGAIFAAWRSSPTGRRSSACRPISSEAASA